MRHLDGIKPRVAEPEITGAESKQEEPLAQPDLGDLFFTRKPPVAKISTPKQHREINFKIDQKKIILVVLILLLLGGGRFVYAVGQKRTDGVKNELNARVAVIETKIGKVQSDTEGGNITAALADLADLKTDIVELKKFAQGWGQDIQYFQVMNGDSELTKKEKLLDAAYDSIILAESLPDDVKKIQATAYLGRDDSVADIKGFRLELGKVIDKLSTFATNSRKNLDGISYTASLLPKLDRLISGLDYTKSIVTNDLSWLSGEDGTDKNLLIIFQNNRELRGGSGGSLGSFGVARIKNGKIQKIDFGTNIYKIDTAFKNKEFVQAPSELEAFGNAWVLKQSGFAVDGQEALDKIRWFYEKETGERVDGAITIDTDAFTSLLRVVGPIEMPAYGKTLNADNFVDETMQEVQNDYFQRDGGKTENEPKKMLSDMTPIFIAKIFAGLNDSQKSYNILQAVKKSFAEKHILVNFSKENLQKEMIKLNVAGKVNLSLGDYLYINNTNLAGDKSNQSMTENVVLTSEIKNTGEVADDLSIQRIHNGKKIAPDGLDRNYIRVLIPENSKLVSFNPVKGNFERYYDRGYKNGQPYWLDKEAGKSTVNFWMSTWPQANTMAKMSYQPNYHVDLKNEFTYAIKFQRQPGAPADNVDFTLTYPEGYSPVNVENFNQLGHTLNFKFIIDTDKDIRIKFVKNIVF